MPTTTHVYNLLRWTYGIVIAAAGIDKFFNVLTDWGHYVNPAVTNVIPEPTLLLAVGVFEIALGLIILLSSARLGGFLAAAWLTLIAVNLATIGLYDIAVRDLTMAVGAYAMARLAEVEVPVAHSHRSHRHPHHRTAHA